MHRVSKLFRTAVICCLAAAFSVAAAGAAATNLPAGFLIGDQNGIRVGVDGAYFIDAVDLEAGDVITKTLTIQNFEPYALLLGMTATPLEETGPLKLLDEVHLSLKLDGREIYSGRVRGDEGADMTRNALDLGEYKPGAVRTLHITLTVSPQMKAYSWTPSEALFKWTFYAFQPTDPKTPKTGLLENNGILYFALGVTTSAVLFLLVLIKKRRREARKEIQAEGPSEPA